MPQSDSLVQLKRNMEILEDLTLYSQCDRVKLIFYLVTSI